LVFENCLKYIPVAIAKRIAFTAETFFPAFPRTPSVPKSVTIKPLKLIALF
jgi:hypothetical protein